MTEEGNWCTCAEAFSCRILTKVIFYDCRIYGNIFLASFYLGIRSHGNIRATSRQAGIVELIAMSSLVKQERHHMELPTKTIASSGAILGHYYSEARASSEAILGHHHMEIPVKTITLPSYAVHVSWVPSTTYDLAQNVLDSSQKISKHSIVHTRCIGIVAQELLSMLKTYQRILYQN